VIFKGPGQGVSTWGGRNVYADPCAWMGSQLNPPVGSSVRGLAAALVAQKGRQASTPTHVTLDGYSGMYLELTTPADLSDCDRGQYRSWLGRYTEPGQQDMLWIINVDGTPLIIDAALGPKLTQQDLAPRSTCAGNAIEVGRKLQGPPSWVRGDQERPCTGRRASAPVLSLP
jgi:hypothetical protein